MWKQSPCLEKEKQKKAIEFMFKTVIKENFIEIKDFQVQTDKADLILENQLGIVNFETDAGKFIGS